MNVLFTWTVLDVEPILNVYGLIARQQLGVTTRLSLNKNVLMLRAQLPSPPPRVLLLKRMPLQQSLPLLTPLLIPLITAAPLSLQQTIRLSLLLHPLNPPMALLPLRLLQLAPTQLPFSRLLSPTITPRSMLQVSSAGSCWS